MEYIDSQLICERCGNRYCSSEWCTVCEDMNDDQVEEMIYQAEQAEIDAWESMRRYW